MGAIGRAAWGSIPLAALLLLTGCASGPSGASKRNVNLLIAQGDYEKAASYIESKKTEYGAKNAVLYYLDRGTVLHHAGKYAESDQAFDAAEIRAEELYTKSLSQHGGMLLLNDTTVDYAGEPYERALLNVFRALNFVFMGKPEEALVESRKVERFLEELKDRLGSKRAYKDDAFARYLDHMLYEDMGKRDDARISMDAAREAYAWYASDYNTPEPSFDLGAPAATGKALGELVFFHYNGVAPRKISKTFQVGWGQALVIAKEDQMEGGDAQFRNALRAGIAGKSIVYSHPEYVQDPFQIASSEVYVDGKLAASTLLVEDISAIAHKTLSDRMPAVSARAIARATIKFVVAENAARAADVQCDRAAEGIKWKADLCKGLSRGIAHGTAAGTEVADTRGWAALPSQIRMARLKLASGLHEIRVDFKSAAGGVIASRVYKDVSIQPERRTYLHHRTAT